MRELELHFVLINGKGSYMDNFLIKQGIPVYYVNYRSKKDLIRVTFFIFRIILREKFRIIHTHLFEATLTGLTAAWLARVPVRIYTRHYSDYHHVWFPSAVKFDRYNNFLATDIIATSVNVQNILLQKEQVAGGKVHLIHHGIDMSDYQPDSVTPDRISGIRGRYSLLGKGPVIGAISRFTELKGLQFLIPAFERVLSNYPEAILVLANASGDYKKEILALLGNLNPVNYRLIEFENDIAALYKTFDCFVHIPVDATAEAFGQTYLESLASLVPSVFTLSGVAPEFIKDKLNALVVPYKDSNAVEAAIYYILNDEASVKEMIKFGYTSVATMFDIHIKISKLEQLYLAE